MKIDSHAHGLHAELDEKTGRRVPPVMSAWRNSTISPEEHIAAHNEHGIEKVLLLDPPEVVFELKGIFGDFVLPCPQIRMDEATPDEIHSLLEHGACGIKFIAPMRPYGDNYYLPLYEALCEHNGLAVFHTGYLVHDHFDPGGIAARPDWIDICNMRPAQLDRINRAFPDLKILMAHFGNPWWEEAWKMLKSNKNIYADFSGGTAYKKSMNMWKEMFAPNGVLDTQAVSKLCYGSDTSMFHEGDFSYGPLIDFYENFYNELDIPGDIRRKIDRDNILMLTSKSA